MRGRFLKLRTLTVFALAVAFLVFVFARLNVDFGAIWGEIRGSNPILYALAFVVYYVTFPLRGWRWQHLLKNAGFGKGDGEMLPSPMNLSQMVLLNWFVNCILYARLGDVYRGYLLREEAGGSFSKIVGTVLAEQVLDIATVFFLLLVAAVGFVGKMRGIVSGILLSGLVILVLLLLVLVAMRRFGSRIERVLPARVRPMYTLFQSGTLGSFRQLPFILFLSVAIWLLEAGRLFLVSRALGFTPALPFVLFVSLANALLSALPLTPGGLGLVESGVAGLFMLTLPREAAWSITFLDRSISYLSLIIFGLGIFGWRELRRLRRPQPDVSSGAPGGDTGKQNGGMEKEER